MKLCRVVCLVYDVGEVKLSELQAAMSFGGAFWLESDHSQIHTIICFSASRSKPIIRPSYK